MSKKYVAGITHTRVTIRRMFGVERNTYQLMRVLTRMLIGVILILLAFLVQVSLAAQGVFLALGCWLLVSRDFPATSRAERVCDMRGDSLPQMHYEFDEQGIALHGEGDMVMPYEKVERLVLDSEYLYIFFGRGNVCMVDKTTIQPANTQKFVAYLQQQTGKEFSTTRSLLTMNARDVVRAVRDRRAEKQTK